MRDTVSVFGRGYRWTESCVAYGRGGIRGKGLSLSLSLCLPLFWFDQCILIPPRRWGSPPFFFNFYTSPGRIMQAKSRGLSMTRSECLEFKMHFISLCSPLSLSHRALLLPGTVSRFFVHRARGPPVSSTSFFFHPLSLNDPHPLLYRICFPLFLSLSLFLFLLLQPSFSVFVLLLFPRISPLARYVQQTAYMSLWTVCGVDKCIKTSGVSSSFKREEDDWVVGG